MLEKLILLPKNRIFELIDKFKFYLLLKDLGLETPTTYIYKEFDTKCIKSKKYILKGRLGNKFINLMNKKCIEIENKYDFRKVKKELTGRISFSEVIIQEVIENYFGTFSCCGFAVDGEIINLFQYQKIRNHPDDYGTGTFLKSIYDELEKDPYLT